MAHDRKPFDIENSCAYDPRVNIEPPDHTLTVDCEVNICGPRYMIAKDRSAFLEPSRTQWPAWLIHQKYFGDNMYHLATNRITIHHLLSAKLVPTGMSKSYDCYQ